MFVRNHLCTFPTSIFFLYIFVPIVEDFLFFQAKDEPHPPEVVFVSVCGGKDLGEDGRSSSIDEKEESRKMGIQRF